jgi:hypothetical protein
MKHFIISTAFVLGMVARPINFNELFVNNASNLIFNKVAPNPVAQIIDNTLAVNTTTNDVPEICKNIYANAKLSRFGLSLNVFSLAYKGYTKMLADGLIQNQLITICDFSKISGAKRLYVINPNTEKLVLNTLVAHGKNSGDAFANSFGNTESSHKSSLGFYVTGETYSGANGFSLHLNGLDAGFNDNALNRSVVIHGADYVSQEMADNNGFIGRSFGCPAVARNVNTQLINEIKDGSCLFIYHPTDAYLNKSKWLN